MRRLIRAFDVLLRRRLGVYDFGASPLALLRVQRSRARRRVALGTGWIEPGQEILDLHMWNEHMPPLPAAGPDVRWAVQVERMFVSSLHELARAVGREPVYRNVRAVRAVTVLLTPGPGAGLHLAQRLGFEVQPHRTPLGRFGEFWENFYTWWLMWTYNAVSVRRRPMFDLRRMDMWMEADEFVRRFGG